MRIARTAFACLAFGAPLLTAAAAPAEPLTIEQFRAELLAVPLCGVPSSGPLVGKPLCTVHLPDGTAVVAGSGILVRGVWEADGDRICRRSPEDPMERRRCVTYERLDAHRYKNSDDVVACIGPCPPAEAAAAPQPAPPVPPQPASEPTAPAPPPAMPQVQPLDDQPPADKPASQ
jgi:hypothetical protein